MQISSITAAKLQNTRQKFNKFNTEVQVLGESNVEAKHVP